MAEPKTKEEAFIGTDSFLKIDGIDGESQDSKHKNEIEIDSVTGNVINQPSTEAGGGAGSSVSQHGDFTFLKPIDKSMPKLMQACATGEHIKKAVLTLRKAGKEQQEFLVITFSDVLVSSFESRNVGGVLPQDLVNLNYGKIEIEYKEQKPDGTLGGSTKAGWNIKERKTV